MYRPSFWYSSLLLVCWLYIFFDFLLGSENIQIDPSPDIQIKGYITGYELLFSNICLIILQMFIGYNVHFIENNYRMWFYELLKFEVETQTNKENELSAQPSTDQMVSPPHQQEG